MHAEISGSSAHRDAAWGVTAIKDVLGVEVVSSKGEALGSVDDVRLNTVTGQIAYVVISVGGFLGLGKHRIAVPWPALRRDEGDPTLFLDRTRSEIEERPEYHKMLHAEEPAFTNRVYAYYGYEPPYALLV